MTEFSAVGAATKRVAVLVDGDNFPLAERKHLMDKCGKHGKAIIRRVYGDMSRRADWAPQTEFHATHCPSGTGNKNRADVQLVIDAMDLAHRRLVDCFVIASNDLDFEPLFSYLRANGWEAWRVKRPATVQGPAAEIVLPVTPRDIEAAKPKAKPKLSKVDSNLLQFLSAGAKSMQDLGHAMKVHGTVKAQTGNATWRSYLKTRPDLFAISGQSVRAVTT